MLGRLALPAHTRYPNPGLSGCPTVALPVKAKTPWLAIPQESVSLMLEEEEV
jgi:hypothetical protein